MPCCQAPTAMLNPMSSLVISGSHGNAVGSAYRQSTCCQIGFNFGTGDETGYRINPGKLRRGPGLRERPISSGDAPRTTFPAAGAPRDDGLGPAALRGIWLRRRVWRDALARPWCQFGNQSSAKRYSRSVVVRLRAKPSSPSTSAMVCALLCWSSQSFSSTVPGEMRR